MVHWAYNGAPLIVENRCNEIVDFALGFLNKSNAWDIDGWWNFEAGEVDRISDEEGDVVARSDRAFVFAKSATRKWKGNTNLKVGDEILPMYEIKLQRLSTMELKYTHTCPAQ